MAGISGKAMLVSLGVFLGLVFFGVSVSLTHFNRLVDPQHPLQLLEWRLEREQLGICFLNENLNVELDRELPDKLKRRAGEKIAPVMYEIREWPTAVQREISENVVLDQAKTAVQKAGDFILAAMERFKKWLWD